MTVRTVLAVAVACALLAATVPAMESVAVERGDATIDAELEALETAAIDLARANDPAPHGPGSRTQLTLGFPQSSWGSAGVETVAFPGADDPGSVVRWRVEGGAWQSRHLEGPPVVARDLDDVGAGRVRVTLRLQTVDGEPTVVLSRANFMADGATRPDHGTTRIPAPGPVRTGSGGRRGPIRGGGV